MYKYYYRKEVDYESIFSAFGVMASIYFQYLE